MLSDQSIGQSLFIRVFIFVTCKQCRIITLAIKYSVYYYFFFIFIALFYAYYIRTCLHKHMRTSFRQILPQTALKILAGRQPACGFLPCLQQNYARKSAHISYEDRFLFNCTNVNENYFPLRVCLICGYPFYGINNFKRIIFIYPF